jgi:hypothetical protein
MSDEVVVFSFMETHDFGNLEIENDTMFWGDWEQT